MKKFVLASVLAGICATASANGGMYVQADMAFGKMNADVKPYEDLGITQKQKLKGSDPAFRVSVGSDVGDFRYALDYTYFGKADKSYDLLNELSDDELALLAVELAEENDINLEDVNLDAIENPKLSAKAEVKAHSVGLTAVRDFKIGTSPVTPYAGVRVGVNRLEGKVSANASVTYEGDDYGISESHGAKTTKMGAGVLAGIQYNITPAVVVDVGAEYNYLGKFHDVKVDQYGAKVGLRYNF